jgi:subtilase family protein
VAVSSMSHITTSGRSLLRTLGLVAILGAVAPDRLPAADFTHVASDVAVRATRADLPASVVTYVSENFPPTRLDSAHYPELVDFTPRRIVQVLCGSDREEYLKVLLARSHLTRADLDRPVGRKGYEIDWPACLFAKSFQTPTTYVVKPGDTFSSIRHRLTGVPGTTASIAEYFDVSPKVVSGGHLRTGAKLAIPYATVGTTWRIEDSKVQELKEVAADASPYTASGALVQVTAPPAPGRIVTYADALTGGNLKEPAECAGATNPPFDAESVNAAYQFSLQRKKILDPGPSRVNVFVIDNGFFGVKPDGAGSIVAGKHFPREYFDTFRWDSGLIGPTTPQDNGEIYPINYQNAMAHATAVSGHGTHVTGLILGGPAWAPYQANTFREGGGPIIKIAEMNVGKGSEFLITNSDQLLARAFSFLHTPYIVNMSITYDGSLRGIGQSFSFMQGSNGTPTPHLFVVAAGNDSLVNNLTQYPAALGGDSANVLTVAALRPDGRLANFTNKGVKVDVAAPGCHVESWLDDKGAIAAFSGTSQAAPTVTFEAVLIRSLIGGAASDLKMRIIASGDVLPNADQTQLATPIAVNVRKALYVYDDYVRYHDATGQHEELGQLLKVDGMACATPPLPIPGESVVAYKTREHTSMIFYAGADDLKLTQCPSGSDLKKGRVVFDRKFNVSNHYAGITGTQPIELSAIDELIRRAPPVPGAQH